VGPSLAGVIGRPAGTLAGYTFSSALAASKLVWNEDTLDQWLAHPSATVPGTKMIFAGVANQSDRAAIIAYLKKSSAAPSP
jgi:cytochrome c